MPESGMKRRTTPLLASTTQDAGRLTSGHVWRLCSTFVLILVAAESPMTVNGAWVGCYVLFEDAEMRGIRVAARPGAVVTVMDADESRDATLICIGGRVVKVD